MKKLFTCFMPLAAVLSASLLFSCTPDIELLPLPPEESSSSSDLALSSSSAGQSSSSVFPGLGSSSSIAGTSGTFKDDRDGKTYRWVKIGEQYWMAENLNYNASGSKCYAEGVSGVSVDSIAKNCATYGRLYNWSTAMANSASSTANPSGVRGVCPSNWHLPSNAEWDELMTAVGGSSVAGRNLKATSGWNSCGPGGSYSSYRCDDTYGFSALPGGRGYSDGSFVIVGSYGFWWSASEYSSYLAYYRYMGYDSEYVYYDDSGKSYLFSVRCVQD